MQDELLKLQKNGQFPDELVKMKGTEIHYVNVRPSDVLVIGGVKEIELEGRL